MKGYRKKLLQCDSEDKQTIVNSKPPPSASPSMAATTGFFESVVVKQKYIYLYLSTMQLEKCIKTFLDEVQ